MGRRWLVTTLLLAPLALGLAGSFLPWFRIDKPGIVSLICLGIALWLGGRALWRRDPGGRRGAVTVLILAALAILPFAVIARAFGRIDMLALLFHAEFGVEGAGLGGLETEIAQAATSLALLVLSLVLLANLWGLGWRMLGPATVALLALNPLVQMLTMRAIAAPPPVDLMAELHPVTLQAPPDPMPDVVVIYLEGSDRRFVHEESFPGVYDPLRSLEPEAITFLNIGQVAGTGWSLAGMVTSQCGVPLLPRGFLWTNNFETVEEFMPAMTCLTDVLGDHGYAMDYIVGADEGFAGIDSFYRTHGVAQPVGMDAMAAMFPADEFEAALMEWVLDDQMTFDAARARLPPLLDGAAPFLQIIETIGPHGPGGYLSRRCTPDGKAAEVPDIGAAARCTFEDTASYIADLRAAHAAADRGRDIRIVLLSDHINHRGDEKGIPMHLQRANTVMFVGGPGAGTVNDVPGSMMDVYPSLLEWLGFTAPGTPAALGRSLLTPDPPPLVARHGIPALDAMLTSDAALSARVWASAGN